MSDLLEFLPDERRKWKQREKERESQNVYVEFSELCLIGKTDYKLKQRFEIMSVTIRISMMINY